MFDTTLPTLLGKDAPLNIDEHKFGQFVRFGINARRGGIMTNDVLGLDGVIHTIDTIILPPRRRWSGVDNEDEWIEGFAEVDEWSIDNLRKIFDM